MFARRNIRRNLVITTSLPLVLLTLFVVHKNRDVIFPRSVSDQYHEYKPDYSQEIFEPVYHVRSKRSTTHNQLSTTYTDKLIQNPNPIISNSYTAPYGNSLNNPRLVVQEYRPIPLMPYPVINTQNLERFVHLDLKGAAPKIDYYQKLFPFLKQLGATGLLIEYEDMFPFTNNLTVIKHGLAYSKHDIQLILQLAAMNGLKIMPLLQVYGHLEYVLKLKEFMHLREDSRYPQVITPCLEQSYTLIFGNN